MIQEKIKVSVVMITYNHEDYIIKSIEGVLNQKCNFNVELIISNDSSTDNSDELIKKYLNNITTSNIKIKYFNHDDNKGMAENFFWTYNQSKGDYVALCEGDDYWIDENKLQYQVDFLDNNKEYELVASSIKTLYKKRIREEDWRWDKKREFFSFEDYLYQLFFHTSTALFRKIKLPTFIKNEDIIQGDVSVFLSVLSKGDLYYMNKCTSVYRKHEGGITNSVKNRKALNRLKSMKIICSELDKYTEFKYSKSLNLKKKMEYFIYQYALTDNIFYKFLYRFFKLRFFLKLKFK